MGCVQSYFKRAHKAGISPSSTQDSSNSKQPVSDDGTKAIQEGHSITEEPESNDTSHGVEATAVRTLAASTGTVAILGTTAKTGDKGSTSPGVTETIPEVEELDENVERAVVHDEAKIEEGGKTSESSSKPATSSSRLLSSQLEENDSKTEESIEVPSPPSTSNTVKEITLVETSGGLNKSPVSDSNKSEVTSPGLKSPTDEVPETSTTKENSLEIVNTDLIKERDEDLSKSISSERLKTNSISNTTLSSDSIAADFENCSVKQSPSADKVVESFDSSSTVEFVDHLKDSSKDTIAQDDRTNTGRSISSDLSNKATLSGDGEKALDVASPDTKENQVENTSYQVDVDDLLPPPPPEVLELSESNELKKEFTEEKQLPVENINSGPSNSDDVNTNWSSKDLTNDEISISEVSSNISSSLPSVVKNDLNVQEDSSKSAILNSSPNASEDKDKAETNSPLSSDNNSSFNDNGDSTSPVTAVILSPAPPKEDALNKKENTNLGKTESIASEKSETPVALTNGTSSEKETHINNLLEEGSSLESISKAEVLETKSSIGNSENDVVGHEVSGNEVTTLLSNVTDKKVSDAATTIQASFRGFQTRQNLNRVQNQDNNNDNSTSEGAEGQRNKPIDDIEKTLRDSVTETATEFVDSILGEVDEKMVQAATTIQANFRGFQTRHTLKNKLDSGLPPSEDLNQSFERSTPTVLTPELIESVKEEVDDICKEAEIIAAERAESADGMKGVHQVVVGMKESTLPSVSPIATMRGSVTPPSVSKTLDFTDGTKEDVFNSLSAVDEKVEIAATTIQATFRGFQTRKQLQNKDQDPSDPMPDYPPPAAEEECPLSLEDLPPPDFEALESSYSEDAPTEPLAPPPDPIIFNEEDEDELVALQRPQECDELPEHRPTATLDTDSSESSLSSAATKIQAGVRGYLTRKQIQTQGQGTGGTGGTTSTSTVTSNVLDSDQSLSVSREDEGVRSAISTEEESEITRHLDSPENREAEMLRARQKSAGKRMSLAETPVSTNKQRAPLRTAMSVQAVTDEEVWNTLKDGADMSDAATRIQSNFRGYRARKQLQREDAMQVTTSGSSQATPSSGSVDAGGRGSAASEASPREERDQPARSSGEFHDIIALTPPNLHLDGGGAMTHAQSGPETETVMVKRRAEEDAREVAAATNIQAGFRAYKTRRELGQQEQAAAKIQAGFRGYKVRKEMKKSHSMGAPMTNIGNVEETAATKIQAGVRGFLVRRRNQKEQDAATKIQAGFRGYHTRKTVPSDQ